jgi:cytoskeletal protein RodZ
MATRKSGDGSRGADEAGVSPGSYAKVSGSRRKRKKKGRSMPPSAPPAGSTAVLASGQPLADSFEDVVDTEGVDTSDEVGRQTQPDWGTATRDERDLSVDDLRRKPTSSRAPRKPLGPLGMDEAPAESVRDSEPAKKLSSPLPPAPAGSVATRMRVIEINPPESANNNASWGDEDAGDAGDDEADDPSSDEFELGPGPDVQAPREHQDPRDSRHDVEALGGGRAADNHNEREDDDELSRILDERLRDSHAPRHSMSSVLGARASLRPSPPPPPEKLSPIWWLMVTLLSAIIIAAGIIAFREATHRSEQAEAPAPTQDTAAPASTPKPGTPSPYDVRNPPSTNAQNSATITSAPSTFPLPTPPAPPERTVLRSPPETATSKPAPAATHAPYAQPAASAPPTPAKPTAAATDAPTTLPAARPPATRVQAPVAKPAARPRSTPAAAAPSAPAPGPQTPPPADIERPIGGASAPSREPSSAPEPAPPAQPPPNREPAALDEARLPINPYAE